MTQLRALREELAFESIGVQLNDDDRHWMFFFRKKHIASYWPASDRGQIIGIPTSVACACVAQARRLAMTAKTDLLEAIALALRGEQPRTPSQAADP